MNVNSFSKAIGLTNNVTIGRIINEDREPSFQILNKIILTFGSVNANWLLTGKGEIFDSSTDNKGGIKNPQQLFKSNNKLKEPQCIPLYNIKATASLTDLFSTENKQIIDHISIPDLPPCDGAVHVIGDSMHPLLKSGDIVLYKQVNDMIDGIFWGEMYLLAVDVGGEEFIAIRYIQKSEIPEHIKLVSYNEHHQSKDVHQKKVHALALVKASIRINSMR